MKKVSIEDLKKSLSDVSAPGAVSQAVIGLYCELRDKSDLLRAILADSRFASVRSLIW